MCVAVAFAVVIVCVVGCRLLSGFSWCTVKLLHVFAVVFGVAIVLIGRAILDAGRLPVERVLLAYLKSSPSSQLAVRLLRALREFLHVPTLAEFATTLLLLTHLSIPGCCYGTFFGSLFWFASIRPVPGASHSTAATSSRRLL